LRYSDRFSNKSIHFRIKIYGNSMLRMLNNQPYIIRDTLAYALYIYVLFPTYNIFCHII